VNCNEIKFFFLLAFLAFCPPQSTARILHVGKGQPYNTIRGAHKEANKSDTLFLHKGLYKEGKIEIEKSLYLTGEPGAVITGDLKYEVLELKADSITVDGIEIQDVGVSNLEDMAAIRVSESDHVVIKNCRINNAFFGIYLAKSHYSRIINNHVQGKADNEYNSGNAIHLWYCRNSLIKGNTVIEHRDGIYLEFVEHSVIKDNLSRQNLRYGLHFMFSNHDEYNNNIFIDNGAGVAVMFSKFIEMCYNTFEQNWGPSSYGLLLKEIYDANVEMNIFNGNTTGIHAEGATRIWFEFNEFKENGWALNIGGSCMNNTIKHNNFISNTFDIVGNSKKQNMGFENNYWSDYSGYDLDYDGIGDIPHRPVKLFNYIIDKVPEAIVLLRSPFVDLLSIAEKVSPVFTPDNIVDLKPAITKFNVRTRRSS